MYSETGLIRGKKYLKIDWSVEMPLHWLIMGCGLLNEWAPGKALATDVMGARWPRG